MAGYPSLLISPPLQIDEGFEVFDQTNEKLNEAKNENQKEKFQEELKKEVKRLQRLRVQVKAWQNEPIIKVVSIWLSLAVSCPAHITPLPLQEKDKKDKLARYRRSVEERMVSEAVIASY